jgi:hypothetical protein
MEAKTVTGVVGDRNGSIRGPERARWVELGSALRFASLIFVAHGLIACGVQAKHEAEGAQAQGALSSQPWTKIAATFPGGGSGPTNVALLTDGSVLAADPQRSDGDPWYRWYRLRPDSAGSYANGTWTTAAFSSIGRQFAPAFVLRDGRYVICGGEYTSDLYELGTHTAPSTALARCEIYDPVADSWTDDTSNVALDLGETIADTAAVEVDDGRVVTLAHDTSNTYGFTSFNVSPTWSPKTGASSLKPYPNNLVSPEGSCNLQQNGDFLCAQFGFVRYHPGLNGTDSWTQLARNPPVSLLSHTSDNEIGPVLQLYPGEMLVLGANSQTFTGAPPKDADAAILSATGDDWSMAAPMRTGQANGASALNHGDVPSVVMPDGRVLVGSDTDDSGVGNGCNHDCAPSPLYEFDATVQGGGSWSLVPNPPSATFTPVGAGIRMLDLPSGQVLVTGTSDGSMWLYTPNGTPNNTWRPTITSISSPSAGEYTLNGTQLNGLTTGGGIGDEGLTATNYPIVYLTDGGGHRYYARSYNFSHMAPKPNQSSNCKFRLPAGIPNGSYSVFVAANGLSSSTGAPLTISGTRISTFVATSPTQAKITLSSPAPFGGTTVNLTSSDSNTLSVSPASVTISQGHTTATINATVNAFGTAIITATIPNSSSSPMSVRLGWTITSFSGPSVMRGDRGAPNIASWLLNISAPAPANAVVTLASNNTAIATVPATVTIPQNATSMTISVTKPGTQRGIARITASAKHTAHTWTFSDRDMDFYKCADGDVGAACFSSILQRYIAYGDNGRVDGRDGHYAYGTFTTASTSCSVATFNNQDPDFGFPKTCYLGVYGFTGAADFQSFTLTGRANVAYGANGAFVYQTMDAGTYSCSPSTFGGVDPAVKVGKGCYVGPDPTAYTWAGDEGATLSNLSNTPVAYGGGGHFTFKVLSGTVLCNTTTFGGDPAFLVNKSCYKLNLTRLAASEGQPFNPPVSQAIYGSGLNGNMFFTASPPADCSFSEFGGDPDFGFNKQCWAP